MQEEGHGHAPTALSRDAPVGPVGNHVAQAGAAVFGVEVGVVYGVQRQLTQGFGRFVFSEYSHALVHTHKPLGCCAVDHWRFVAPAVGVAVHYVGGAKQAVRIAQGIDDDRARFPDMLPAKQWQLWRIRTVALHRVQDVVIRHAVRHTAVEIFYPIGGGRVHNTGAVVCCGVVC